MATYETVLYDERDGVAWITLNRPEVLNAFNQQMQVELKAIWRGMRHNDDVRCAVITGAGERAFCVGIDRSETMGEWESPDDVGQKSVVPGGEESNTPWHFDDPGENLGPKSNDLWKPVIAAVNGMACGGAFYILGEVEFIIAVEGATFFDPHTTYGMTACFESMHMLQKMPFHEVMRMALLGAHERISAHQAQTIGLVSEVVAPDDLHASAAWAAEAIASAPPIAIQGTVRSIWAAQDLPRRDALEMGKVLIRLGSDAKTLFAGQQTYLSGKRIKPKIR